MGMDFLDILFRLEKTFGIDRIIIPADFPELKTAGDLVALVEKRVREGTPTKEQLAILDENNLLILRQNLAGILGVSVDTLSAETTFRDVIPRRMRRKVWKELYQLVDDIQIGRKVIGVTSCPWHMGNLVILILASLVACLVYWLVNEWFGHFHFWQFTIMAVILLPIWFISIIMASAFWAPDIIETRIPPQKLTLGEAAEKMSEKIRRRLGPDETPLSHEEIERRVYEILNAALGVPVEEISPEKELVRDLGMG